MKNTITRSVFTFLFTLIMFTGFANPTPQNSCLNTYKGGLKKFMEIAARQNKPVLLVICKPGCHSCAEVATSVSQSGADLNFVNRFFISCHVDLQQEREIAASLLKKIGSQGEPSFVFLTPTGQFIHKSAFIPHRDTLISLTASVLKQYQDYKNILLASSYGQNTQVLQQLAKEYAASVMSHDQASVVSSLKQLTQGDERLIAFEQSFLTVVHNQMTTPARNQTAGYGGPVSEEE